MKYISQNKLYCFSPLVMLATFIIEIALALYTVWRYGLNSITRIAVAILVCLAFFQLAEFNVCEGAWGVDSATWARLGYVAITLLPPMGVHLIARLAGDTRRWPYFAAYLLSAAFIGYFLLSTNGVAAGACLGNYVLFEKAANVAALYGVYYYGLLLAAIGYAIFLARKPKTTPAVRRSLYALTIGYALFMVPTTVVNIIDPSTTAGIPSIMCGFAVLLAIVLVGAVLPFAHAGKKAKKSTKKP